MCQGIEKSLHIVACRADVVAGRDHLLTVRLLAGPLSCLDRRHSCASSLQQAGATTHAGLCDLFCGGSNVVRRFKKADFIVGTRGGSQVCAFEAEMLERRTNFT